MRPKQREAFDLLTLQLVERGYIRADLLPGRDGGRPPGVWTPIGYSRPRLFILDAVRVGRFGGGWEIEVFAPNFGADQLGCWIAAFDQEGERIYADDIGAPISWEGLDQALKWAENLAAQVGAGLELA